MFVLYKYRIKTVISVINLLFYTSRWYISLYKKHTTLIILQNIDQNDCFTKLHPPGVFKNRNITKHYELLRKSIDKDLKWCYY